jgi:threonine dehydratase
MPTSTPKLKINKARAHGGDWMEIVLTGVSFDDAVN